MRTPSGIQDLHLAWAAGQQMLPSVNCILAPGRTLADWSSFVLTIRQDPKWIRAGTDLYDQPDPIGEGWTVVVQATGTPDPAGGPTAVQFSFATPTAPGVRRYVLDVWGLGGDAGAVAFISTTWLTILPAVTVSGA